MYCISFTCSLLWTSYVNLVCQCELVINWDPRANGCFLVISVLSLRTPFSLLEFHLESWLFPRQLGRLLAQICFPAVHVWHCSWGWSEEQIWSQKAASSITVMATGVDLWEGTCALHAPVPSVWQWPQAPKPNAQMLRSHLEESSCTNAQ